MQNRIFTIDKYGKPLMPCKPRTCRKLLLCNLAKVVHKQPFTIQLLTNVQHYQQPVSIGCDSGQNHVGLAVTSQHQVLWQGEIGLRQDVKSLLDNKRIYRRSRRNRKTRYRKARFLNRVASKRVGWLPPSIAQKVQHNINWINKIVDKCPNPTLHIEVGKFNPAKMINPNISGLAYQKGDMLGYENAKAYVLERDHHLCQVCHNPKNQKLRIHHIIFKACGGTNRVTNLITVCSKCHTAKNHVTGVLHDWMVQRKQTSQDYRSATFMNILRQRLYQAFPDAQFQYGYETSYQRQQLGLFKSHFNDAVTISGIKLIKQQPNTVVMTQQFRKKKRSLHEAIARKGRKNKNVTQKRNAKNTPWVYIKKSNTTFYLHDRVRLPNGDCGFIKGFSGSSAYVVNIFGQYLTVSKKYKQIPLSKLNGLTHNNNFLTDTITLSAYQME